MKPAPLQIGILGLGEGVSILSAACQSKLAEPRLLCDLELGYSGVSHKNCKGVFKGLRNTCLVRKRRAESPGERPWLTTAEDLCNIGPVALLQDFAVQAALGHETIERNGHHYFAGLSMFDTAIRESMLTHHPDLYQSNPQCGCRLCIDAGCIQLESVNRAPFGSAPTPST